MDEFELLEAKTGAVSLPMPWRRDRQKMDLAVFFEQGAHQHSRAGNNLTAIIGRNGTGKSHLLSAIVDTFFRLEQVASGKRTTIRNLPLQELRYRVGKDVCEVLQYVSGSPELRVNGELTPIELFPLPKRVVALTTSPFDKFVVPVLNSFSISPKESSIYRYLGLRDRTGRAALENLLFRSLNSLFETPANEAWRRANIGRVFDFLGLRPQLTVIYKMRVAKKVRRAIEMGVPFLNEEIVADRARLSRAQDVVRSEEASEQELAFLLQTAMEKADGDTISVSADFLSSAGPDPLFLQLRPLRRAGFLQLRAVEVTHANGVISDLRRASSGQLSMASSLLALAAEIANGSLVLIDEPELSLHPHWQIKYVDLLLQTFKNYTGCHFILATHSPLVISELPAHSTVLSLDSDDPLNTDELSGQSADFLLAEAFGMPTNNNRYVKDRIVHALRLAADGKATTAEFKEEVGHLQKFAHDMEQGSPVRDVIEKLEGVIEAAKKGQ